MCEKVGLRGYVAWQLDWGWSKTKEENHLYSDD
jgi:hypothetical protein